MRLPVEDVIGNKTAAAQLKIATGRSRRIDLRIVQPRHRFRKQAEGFFDLAFFLGRDIMLLGELRLSWLLRRSPGSRPAARLALRRLQKDRG